MILLCTIYNTMFCRFTQTFGIADLSYLFWPSQGRWLFHLNCFHFTMSGPYTVYDLRIDEGLIVTYNCLHLRHFGLCLLVGIVSLNFLFYTSIDNQFHA